MAQDPSIKKLFVELAELKSSIQQIEAKIGLNKPVRRLYCGACGKPCGIVNLGNSSCCYAQIFSKAVVEPEKGVNIFATELIITRSKALIEDLALKTGWSKGYIKAFI